ncbi:uncharacterized protein LOC124947997 [Vespa velutina]|uniref:uncharacterized protein LOC124947997 n=1 Tax=Vespa velutina TaxID=202808 RepID=UPI001FB284EC|nr:uncharacterized protein LOC124947997 [Vespa velutina]
MVFSTIVITTALKGALGLVGTGLWLVPLLIAALSYYQYDQLDPESRPIDRYPLNPEYDFIVIGGGSAGAVVANRLSEISNWNILLLEAGPDENEITDVPSLAAYLQLTKLDWKYKIEATGRACLAMKGGRCNWPRGKVLGGSSVLNYMLYVRGNRHDYDYWEALGNPGWGYKEALYYFKKSEDNRNPYLRNNPYHSTGGYLTVQESPWITPLAVAFLQSGVELGYDLRDINGEFQTGFMIPQGTIRRGSRCSTAKAFLRPIRLRRNFHTAMNSHVTKIVINPFTMKAIGVEFVRNGRKQYVRARKEVILSAGAINSPQILMLSGIGPKEHLRQIGIPLLKDLRVGENLQDHVGMGGLTFLVDKPVAIVQKRFYGAPVTMHYAANGKGPMTTLGGIEGYAFINTKFANKSIDYPDIQIHMAPASLNSDGGVQIKKVLGIKDEVYDTVYDPIANKDAFTFIPLLLRPRSRGTVKLKSSNPFHNPIIDANYFDDPLDIATLVEGAKIAVKLAEAKVFKQFGTRLHRLKIPGCRHLKFSSDAYWECHIRHISMTIYHPVGTTKMGPQNDPTAVVDPRLRVYGIRNIRVIDTSIMPTICSGNTNAPAIMIGEKGADLIKSDWLSFDMMLRIIIVLSLLSLISTVRSATFFDLLKEYKDKDVQIKTTYYPKWEKYDFIIVGAGSGGSVLANRLSENKNWKILLLEAGYPENLIQQIPIFVNILQMTDYNWGYNVEPQNNTCFGMINRQCAWPRGKSLGGTSTINYMIFTRGDKLDYDYWAALGNEGWSYEEILPYYIKSEKFDVPDIINSPYHGKDGYVSVEYVPFHTELSTTFLEAGKRLGYDVLDYNGEKRIGYSYLQLNMDKGARCSASKAYLRVKRPNLDIVTGARVTKVLIDENRQAYGIQYIKNNNKKLVFSTKEVLLSAGTIDSAKLLMLSGIGPKEHLEELEIQVIQDSKVGYNMYEHIGFLGLTFLIDQPVSLSQSKVFNPHSLWEYAFKRNGYIAIPGGAEALAFIRTKYAPSEKPDIELLFASGSIHSDHGVDIKKNIRMTDDLYNTVYKPIENRDGLSIWPIIQSPKSVGRLTLTSKNPFVPPKIEPNFFSHPDDIEILLEGIKHAINVSKTEPFLAYNTRLHDIKIPGCEFYEFNTDDYWRCAIKYLPFMMNHEIGTVKMGPKTDPYAVVDSRLRVYGIKNLRVVDASIMPTIPIGHVNAGIFMIGEKAADMIKQDWSRDATGNN